MTEISKSDKVLILGSGHSALEVTKYPYVDNGWTIVAVNNAWKATDDWSYLMLSTDFYGDRPNTSCPPHNKKTITNKYTDVLHHYGGHHKCGYSITCCTGYWCLWTLSPKVLAFLGCDLNYVPNDNGDTHFYGQGFDIKKHGVSDYERFLQQYRDDQFNNSAELIYARLQYYALKDRCKVYNLSSDPDTVLPFKQTTAEKLDKSTI